jgi:hypothetical protein
MTHVQPSELNRHISQTVQVMNNLAEAVVATEPRNGHRPADGSVARRELDDVEPALPVTKWSEPLRDVQPGRHHAFRGG